MTPKQQIEAALTRLPERADPTAQLNAAVGRSRNPQIMPVTPPQTPVEEPSVDFFGSDSGYGSMPAPVVSENGYTGYQANASDILNKALEKYRPAEPGKTTEKQINVLKATDRKKDALDPNWRSYRIRPDQIEDADTLGNFTDQDPNISTPTEKAKRLTSANPTEARTFDAFETWHETDLPIPETWEDFYDYKASLNPQGRVAATMKKMNKQRIAASKILDKPFEEITPTDVFSLGDNTTQKFRNLIGEGQDTFNTNNAEEYSGPLQDEDSRYPEVKMQNKGTGLYGRDLENIRNPITGKDIVAELNNPEDNAAYDSFFNSRRKLEDLKKVDVEEKVSSKGNKEKGAVTDAQLDTVGGQLANVEAAVVSGADRLIRSIVSAPLDVVNYGLRTGIDESEIKQYDDLLTKDNERASLRDSLKTIDANDPQRKQIEDRLIILDQDTPEEAKFRKGLSYARLDASNQVEGGLYNINAGQQDIADRVNRKDIKKVNEINEEKWKDNIEPLFERAAGKFDDGDVAGATVDTLRAFRDGGLGWLTTAIDDPGASVTALGESIPQMYALAKKGTIAGISYFVDLAEETYQEFKKNHDGKEPDVGEQALIIATAAGQVVLEGRGAKAVLGGAVKDTAKDTAKETVKNTTKDKVANKIKESIPTPIKEAGKKVSKAADAVPDLVKKPTGAFLKEGTTEFGQGALSEVGSKQEAAKIDLSGPYAESALGAAGGGAIRGTTSAIEATADVTKKVTDKLLDKQGNLNKQNSGDTSVVLEQAKKETDSGKAVDMLANQYRKETTIIGKQLILEELKLRSSNVEGNFQKGAKELERQIRVLKNKAPSPETKEEISKLETKLFSALEKSKAATATRTDLNDDLTKIQTKASDKSVNRLANPKNEIGTDNYRRDLTTVLNSAMYGIPINTTALENNSSLPDSAKAAIDTAISIGSTGLGLNVEELSAAKKDLQEMLEIVQAGKKDVQVSLDTVLARRLLKFKTTDTSWTNEGNKNDAKFIKDHLEPNIELLDGQIKNIQLIPKQVSGKSTEQVSPDEIPESRVDSAEVSTPTKATPKAVNTQETSVEAADTAPVVGTKEDAAPATGKAASEQAIPSSRTESQNNSQTKESLTEKSTETINKSEQETAAAESTQATQSSNESRQISNKINEPGSSIPTQKIEKSGERTSTKSAVADSKTDRAKKRQDKVDELREEGNALIQRAEADQKEIAAGETTLKGEDLKSFKRTTKRKLKEGQDKVKAANDIQARNTSLLQPLATEFKKQAAALIAEVEQARTAIANGITELTGTKLAEYIGKIDQKQERADSMLAAAKLIEQQHQNRLEDEANTFPNIDQTTKDELNSKSTAALQARLKNLNRLIERTGERIRLAGIDTVVDAVEIVAYLKHVLAERSKDNSDNSGNSGKGSPTTSKSDTKPVMKSKAIPKKKSEGKSKPESKPAAKSEKKPKTIAEAKNDNKQAVDNVQQEQDWEAINAQQEEERYAQYLFEQGLEGIPGGLTVSSQNVKQLFIETENIGNTKDSPEHKIWLKNIMDTLVLPALKHLETTDPTGDSVIYLGSLDSMVQSAPNMSGQEILTFEVLHAVFNKGRETDPAIEQALYALRDKAEKVITVEDFLSRDEDGNVKIVVDLESELKAAQKRYDQVFNNSDPNSLNDFAALGLTNQAVIGTLNADERSKPILEGLKDLYKKITDWIKRTAAGKTNKGTNKSTEALGDLVRDIANIQAAHLSKVDQTWNVVWEMVNTPAKIALKNLILNPFGKVISKLSIKERIDDFAYGYGLTMDNMGHKFIGEVVGPNEGAKPFHALLRDVRHSITTAMEEMALSTSNNIVRAFNKGKKITDAEWEMLNTGILKTDLSTLLNDYSLTQIAEFLEDGKALKKEIQNIQATLKKAYPNNHNYYSAQAESLGIYMMTGKGVRRQQMLNAYNIAQLKNVPPAIGTQEGDLDAAEALIDRLATLSAVDNTLGKVREFTAQKIREETARDVSINGIDLLLGTHRNFKEESLKRSFAGSKSMMVKGYTHEMYDEFINIKMGTKEDEAAFRKEGYVIGDKVKVDYTYKGTIADMYIYGSKDGIFNQRVAGIMSLENPEAIGSDIYSSGLVQENNLGKHLSADRVQKEFQKYLRDSKKELLEQFAGTNKTDVNNNWLIPLVNPDGEIRNLRYVMSEETKVNTFGKSDLAHRVMGAMTAGIINKEQTVASNRRFLELAKKDQDDNYGKNPRSYVRVGANVSNKKYQKIYQQMPAQTKQDIKEIWGGSAMLIREDLIDLSFGFAKIAFTEYVDNKTGNRLPGFAKQTTKLAGNIWETVVGIAKRNVVLMIPDVVINNVFSNEALLTVKGVPLVYGLSKQVEGIKNLNIYKKDRDEQLKLEQRISALPEHKDIVRWETRLKNIEKKIKKNPIKPFLDEGLIQHLVDDVQISGEGSGTRLLKAALPLKTAKKLNRAGIKYVPGSIRTAAKYAFLHPDTKPGKAIANATQASDLIARYALYHYRVDQQGMRSQDAIEEVVDTFIDYDSPTSPEMQKANDMGIIMFTKFALRIQRVIAKTFKENPALAGTIVLADDTIMKIPNVQGSLLPFHGLHSPGAFQILDNATQINGVTYPLDFTDYF